MSEHAESRSITVSARPHPDHEVQRAGFALDHRYVEQCWAPIIGPSTTLLLRRLPWLWRAGTTIELNVAELGQSLGLGGGGGRNSVIARTLQRLVHFDFGRWNTPNELDVFTEVRPLSPRLLGRVPAWTRVLHDQLLDAHLEHLATFGVAAPPRPGVDPVVLSRAAHVPSRTNDGAPGLAL